MDRMMGHTSSSKKPILWVSVILSVIGGMYCWSAAAMNASFAVATDGDERYLSAGTMWTYGGWIMFVVATVLVVVAIRSSRAAYKVKQSQVRD